MYIYKLARFHVASTKSLVSSLEEGRSRRIGNPSMELSVDGSMELQERRREERQICSQCHQRMIRANIGMKVFVHILLNY